MCCRMTEFKNKQVVCIKNGCVLGYVSDVEIDTTNGTLRAIVIFGRFKVFGLLVREEDIVIPWNEISVIGKETILVNTDPEIYVNYFKNNRFK